MAWSTTCALCSEELYKTFPPVQTVVGHRPGSNRETTIVIRVCETCKAYLTDRVANVWKERI